MRSCVAFIAMAALAGCYRPSFQSCELQCAPGAAQRCPEGYSCSNGRCAEGTSTCSAGGDDGGIDGEGGMANVTVNVQKPDGSPLTDNVIVVFLDPSGAELTRVVSNPQGVATATVPTGSSATVVRQITANDWQVTTYLGLWDGAVITSKFEASTGIRSVFISSEPDTSISGGSVGHTYIGACEPASHYVGSDSSATMNIPVRCPSFDVIAIAATTSETHYATLAAQTGTSVTVTSAQWAASNTFNYSPLNAAAVPSPAAIMAWVSADRPILYPIGESSPGTSLRVPSTGGVTVNPVLSTTSQGLEIKSEVFDVMPVGALDYNKDFAASRFLAFTPELPSFDRGTRTMSWATSLLPTGLTAALPSLAYAHVAYTHGAHHVVWHLIGSNEKVVDSSRTYSMTFPDLPNDLAFDFESGDLLEGNPKVHAFKVTPGKEREVMQVLESNQQSLDVFTVPGLDYVARAVTP